jgi:hypothetical protein
MQILALWRNDLSMNMSTDNVRFVHELVSSCEVNSAISTILNPACDASAQEIAV